MSSRLAAGPRPAPPDAIERELKSLWRRLTAVPPADAGARAMQPLLANLAAVGRTAGEADAFLAPIGDLIGRAPCRAILAAVDPDSGPPALESEVAILCCESPACARRVCCDLIRLSARGRRAADLPSLAASLWVPDLPIVLWWPRPALETSAFEGLARQAQRLIVDSAAAGCGSLPALAGFLDRTRLSGPAVSDLTWCRLTPVRHLMAQFFDSPDACRCLAQIDRLQIEADPVAGRLLAGWMQTRTRCGGGAAGPGARIELAGQGTQLGLFSGLRLTCSGGAAEFFIRRDRGGRAALRARVGGRAWTSSAALAAAPTADLLAAELAFPGRDAGYEEALAAAARLPADDLTAGGD